VAGNELTESMIEATVTRIRLTSSAEERERLRSILHESWKTRARRATEPRALRRTMGRVSTLLEHPQFASMPEATVQAFSRRLSVLAREHITGCGPVQSWRREAEINDICGLLAATLEWLVPWESRKLLRAVGHCKSVQEVQERLRASEEALLKRVRKRAARLPATVRLDSTRELCRITTPEDLRAVGEKLKNCLRHARSLQSGVKHGSREFWEFLSGGRTEGVLEIDPVTRHVVEASDIPPSVRSRVLHGVSARERYRRR